VWPNQEPALLFLYVAWPCYTNDNDVHWTLAESFSEAWRVGTKRRPPGCRPAITVVLFTRVDACWTRDPPPFRSTAREHRAGAKRKHLPGIPMAGSMEMGHGVVPVPAHRRPRGNLRQSSPANARRALAWPRDLRQTERLFPRPTNHLLANCSRLFCPNEAATFRGGPGHAYGCGTLFTAGRQDGMMSMLATIGQRSPHERDHVVTTAVVPASHSIYSPTEWAWYWFSSI
jgi:hypothetical protein